MIDDFDVTEYVATREVAITRMSGRITLPKGARLRLLRDDASLRPGELARLLASGTLRPVAGWRRHERIDLVPGELKERVSALAIVHGYGSAAEYVRDLLVRHVYGELAHVQTYSRRRSGPMGGTSE